MRPPAVRAGRPAPGAAVAPPGLMRLELEDPAWSRFVHSCPEATPFHHPAWASLVAGTYAFPAFALALADEHREVIAGAPFVLARGLSGRRRAISLPFTDACAPMALRDAAPRFVAELGGTARGPLEVRADVEAAGWTRRTDAVTHVLALEPDVEAVMARLGRSQARRNIRRAEREGVTVRAAGSVADLDAFYSLHARTRRRQGVPVQPRRFFDAIWRTMVRDDLGEILLAERGGAPLATALFLYFNGTTIYKFGASDPGGWPARPNHAIFATAIERACGRGDRRLDFGRTDLGNAGLRAFKSSWGAVERPLTCSVLDAAADHESRATRTLGAVIRRGPAWVGRGAGAALYRYAASR